MDKQKNATANASLSNRKEPKYIITIAAAVIAVCLGIVLFVADKTGAGITFIVAAILIALPLGRLTEKYPIVRWLRIAIVLFLFTVAIINIANTDIPPDADVTGLKFIDQVLAIFNRFFATVFGE